MKATCKYCDETFVRRHKNHVSCSTACRETFRRNNSSEERKEKMRKYKKAWSKKNEKYGRTYHLQRTFGITLEQYSELLEKQNTRCAICEKHESEEKRSFAVDHNHITGEIRGLLCYYCNNKLVGRHRDGELLRKIADYVEQGTGWFVPKKKPKKRKKH